MNTKELEKRCNELFFQVNEKTERIADLEKENAELKLKLEALEGQTPWKDIKDKSEVIGKIAKAKEIIKKFLLWENDWHNKTENKYELLKQAEQFISEMEK